MLRDKNNCIHKQNYLNSCNFFPNIKPLQISRHVEPVTPNLQFFKRILEISLTPFNIFKFHNILIVKQRISRYVVVNLYWWYFSFPISAPCNLQHTQLKCRYLKINRPFRQNELPLRSSVPFARVAVLLWKPTFFLLLLLPLLLLILLEEKGKNVKWYLFQKSSAYISMHIF